MTKTFIGLLFAAVLLATGCGDTSEHDEVATRTSVPATISSTPPPQKVRVSVNSGENFARACNLAVDEATRGEFNQPFDAVNCLSGKYDVTTDDNKNFLIKYEVKGRSFGCTVLSTGNRPLDFASCF